MRGALRHYHFLDALASRHEVTLIALEKTEPTPEAMKWVRSSVKRLHLVPVPSPGSNGTELQAGSLEWAGWRAHKALLLRRARVRMRRIFREEAHTGEHDIVLFHGKEIFSVVEGFRELPLLADICDATSLRLRGHIPHSRGFERPWAVLAWLRALRADRKLVRQTPHRIFIAARDRDALLSPGQSARIVPNGIDLDYWSRGEVPRSPARIILTGVMDYPPNEDGALWLLEEILPRVRDEMSGAEVVIAGRDPTRRLQEVAERTPGARVTGYVDDLRPYLAESTVFAASLRFASGLQNKVLEALAMEVPVVATPPVADGVRVEGGRTPPLRVADDTSGFSRALVEMLRSPDRRTRLAARGRSYVERHFDWASSSESLLRACRRVADPRGSGRGRVDRLP